MDSLLPEKAPHTEPRRMIVDPSVLALRNAPRPPKLYEIFFSLQTLHNTTPYH